MSVYNLFNDDLGEINQSLQSDDHSEVVMKLYEKLRYVPPALNLETKSEEKSDACRRQGNDAFSLHRYRQALMFYNMALCYAPKNSRSLKLAYSNRSALLYRLKEFKDALKNIEMCYQLGCPDDLVQKLKIREEKCCQFTKMNDYTEYVKKKIVSSADFLNLGLHNDSIPCASKAVKLDTSGPQPRIVAAENIDVGAIVALETAYVITSESDQDSYLTCHHCTKSSFNLIPCDKCCLVMFCDETCKNTSSNEYHAIECKIRCKEYIGKFNLVLKAVIKMKNSCSDWKKFIEASSNITTNQPDKMRHEKFFSCTNPFSLLHNTTYIPFGKKANYAIIATIMIKNLEDTSSYFPLRRNDKLLAMHATAKILMHLLLHSRELTLTQCAIISPTHNVSESHFTSGFYVFLGKLEHSCYPNVFVTAMKNKAVATALQPIRRGTTLTISYFGHYLYKMPNIPLHMYISLRTVCFCKVCTEKWGEIFMKDYKLSPAQEKYFITFDLKNIISNVYRDRGLDAAYHRTCQGLELFTDLPNTKEYKDIFLAFFQIQQALRCTKTESKTTLDE